MIALSQGILAFYVIACIGFGSLLMRVIARKAWRMEGQAALFVTTIYFLLGMGVLANVWIILGLLGWLSPWLIATLCAVFIVASMGSISSLAKRLLDDLRSGITQFKLVAWPWKILVLLALLLVLLAGVGSLLPPYSDAAAFYMPIARVTAASHRLVPLRGSIEAFSQIGLLGELHYASLISIGSVEAAKEFNWLVGMATAIMVAAVGSKIGLGRKGQWIAVVMVLTSTAVTHIIMNGKVDLFGASLGAAAFYWALHWRGYQPRHALWLAGIFAGMAVIAKLSYAAVLVPAILILIVWRLVAWRDKDLPEGVTLAQFASTIMQLGCWMALMAIPHMLKNGLLFGQPLSPFINTAGTAYLSPQQWFSPEVTRKLILTYPIALVLGYTPMQGGQLSPLLLAFFPLAFLLRKPRRFLSSPLVQLTLSAMAGVIVWVAATPSVLAPRYILAPVLMFIPVLARGAESLFLDRTRSRLLVVGAFVVLLSFLSFSLISVGIYAQQSLQIMTGAYGACEFQGANCRAMSLLSQEAEMGDRIFLAESHGDMLRPDLLQCVADRAEMGAVVGASSTEARWANLIDRGFQYIAVNPSSHAAYAEALDINQAPEWIDYTEFFQENGYKVFQIASTDPLRQPSMACRQIDPPAWQIVPVDQAAGNN